MKSKRILTRLSGVSLFLLMWQVAAVMLHSLVIASPLETAAALGELLKQDFICDDFFVTMVRMFSGVMFAFAAGLALGMAAGCSRTVRDLLEPFRWMLMSIPAVVFLVVVMLVLGMGTKMIIVFSSLMLCPVVYINTVEGIDSIDEQLLEMAKVYRLNRFRRLREIYIPAITGHVIASLVIVTGNGIRIVVLSELLGASNGLGAIIASARTNLDIPRLYACVLLCLLAAGGIEFILLRPVQNYLLRWKQ